MFLGRGTQLNNKFLHVKLLFQSWFHFSIAYSSTNASHAPSATYVWISLYKKWRMLAAVVVTTTLEPTDIAARGVRFVMFSFLHFPLQILHFHTENNSNMSAVSMFFPCFLRLILKCSYERKLWRLQDRCLRCVHIIGFVFNFLWNSENDSCFIQRPYFVRADLLSHFVFWRSLEHAPLWEETIYRRSCQLCFFPWPGSSHSYSEFHLLLRFLSYNCFNWISIFVLLVASCQIQTAVDSFCFYLCVCTRSKRNMRIEEPSRLASDQWQTQNKKLFS